MPSSVFCAAHHVPDLDACTCIGTPAPITDVCAVAYPIMQCALFVAGLWGVFAFHEIQALWVGLGMMRVRVGVRGRVSVRRLRQGLRWSCS